MPHLLAAEEVAYALVQSAPDLILVDIPYLTFEGTNVMESEDRDLRRWQKQRFDGNRVVLLSVRHMVPLLLFSGMTATA